MNEKTNIERFAAGLVRKPVDPNTLARARAWYQRYAGRFAVSIDDREVVEIYESLQY